MRPDEPVQEFNSLLLRSLDESITSLLGTEVTEALYLHLLKFHGIPREEVPYQIDILEAQLEQIFGHSGKTIERRVAKRFYIALGIQFVAKSNYTLVDYVNGARQTHAKKLASAKITESKG